MTEEGSNGLHGHGRSHQVDRGHAAPRARPSKLRNELKSGRIITHGLELADLLHELDGFRLGRFRYREFGDSVSDGPLYFVRLRRAEYDDQTTILDRLQKGVLALFGQPLRLVQDDNERAAAQVAIVQALDYGAHPVDGPLGGGVELLEGVCGFGDDRKARRAFGARLAGLKTVAYDGSGDYPGEGRLPAPLRTAEHEGSVGQAALGAQLQEEAHDGLVPDHVREATGPILEIEGLSHGKVYTGRSETGESRSDLFAQAEEPGHRPNIRPPGQAHGGEVVADLDPGPMNRGPVVRHVPADEP
ncbi:MAG: hypothetical protein BWY99_01619 [Synergistetes bacterium ADurb.BinA166]|nr:MAG: hypothetical protein BWY99_01619 [Synergistetes bacterium ADurb.BinA166]